MLQTVSRRALCAAAALSFAAGCSGNTLTSGGSSALTPSTHVAGQAWRILPGPVVSGPILIPLTHPITNAPKGWPDKKKKKKSILFVADCDGGVLMYDPTKANSSPIGSITTGTDCAFGAAVDKAGNLYVANISGNSVTVYPKGQSSPSLTITDAVSSPYSVAVDSKGNVFVSNLGNNTITAYAPGGTSAFETINFNAYGQAVGINTDGSDNVWVACDTSNGVFVIKAGSSERYELGSHRRSRAHRRFVWPEGRRVRFELLHDQRNRVHSRSNEPVPNDYRRFDRSDAKRSYRQGRVLPKQSRRQRRRF